MSDGECAIKWDFAHDAFHKRRFAFAVTSDECYFFATADAKVDIVEHKVFAVSFFHAFADNGKVAATLAGREFQMQTGIVHFIDFNGDHLFQLLDPALHLHSLGRLVAEAFDEVADIGHFLLLVLVGPELCFAAFGT